MLFWRVPAPNEALLISGSKKNDQGTPFRIVTGHGCFVIPVKQKARFLSLSLQEAEIAEECVTTQGIRLRMRAVAVFKVGDDATSIANAARRFLAEQTRMEELVGRIFAGHLRSIIGGLTVEEIIRERDRVAQEIKDGSHSEMEKLGIVVDGLQIQEIEDQAGYIANLAAPHSAAVASHARIAAAQADQAASKEEQTAAAFKAEFARNTAIKEAGFAAEVQEAQARSAQAGPLAAAKAEQEVIEQRTALAQREADLTTQRLEADVRRPADAEAYRQRTLADAGRDRVKAETEAEAHRQRTLAESGRDALHQSTAADTDRRRAMAEAEADATRVTALAHAAATQAAAEGQAYAERALAAAEAEAINARADALAGENQALIAANRLVDMLPTLVEAAARGIAGSNLTVLNGTSGVNEVAAGIVGQGLSIYETLRAALPSPAPAPNGTGTTETAEKAPVRAPAPSSNGTVGAAGAAS